jgi:hypothetical protein
MTKIYTKKNPRFVWNIGSISEVYPDMPEQNSGAILWDRQERKPVLTLHAEYSQSFCLETTTSPQSMPYTILEEFWNKLSNRALISEGMKPTR